MLRNNLVEVNIARFVKTPKTKKKMLFKAELPQDLQQALEILKNG